MRHGLFLARQVWAGAVLGLPPAVLVTTLGLFAGGLPATGDGAMSGIPKICNRNLRGFLRAWTLLC